MLTVNTYINKYITSRFMCNKTAHSTPYCIL